MIISRTPLRIEFTGGSDLPAFYHHEPGAIINAAINKYIYVMVRYPDFPTEEDFHLTYDTVEKDKDLDKLKNELARETLRLKKVKRSFMVSISDLPSQTGLGSSGSFVVGFLNTLYHIEGKKVSPKRLAQEAFYIESKMVGVKCGSQDQLAAAYGGIRLQEFFPDDKIKSTLVKTSNATSKKLEESLLMFYTGNKRSSHNLLDNLWKTLDKNQKSRDLMSKRVKLSHEMKKELEKNSLSNFGAMLDEEWRLKKAIAPIETNSTIDSIYNKAKKNGALGGKLVGAGGSGFMLFYAPKSSHAKIKKALSPLHCMGFSFSKTGSKIISKKED